MHIVKKIFSGITGYWIHKIETLPVGADLFIDIHKRINYGPLYTMFDVGANTGQTREWFRNNEHQAKIYCFEPVLQPFEELKKRVSGDKYCVNENFALGEIPGKKIVSLFEEYSTYNSLKNELMNQDRDAAKETITIDTLDNYCKKNAISKIDLLKIDTEGYEMNVLKGGEQILESGSVPFIFCETGFLIKNKRNTNFSELTEWLANKNYYFFGMYQLNAHAWKQGYYFGNALYVHKDVYNP